MVIRQLHFLRHLLRITSKAEWVLNQVKIAVAEYLQMNVDKTSKDVKISCLALAFKANIDDLRESPALRIVQRLECELSSPMIAVEPNITELPSSLKRTKLMSLDNAIAAANIIIVLVEHKEFMSIKISSNKVVIDTKGEVSI